MLREPRSLLALRAFMKSYSRERLQSSFIEVCVRDLDQASSRRHVPALQPLGPFTSVPAPESLVRS
jgi:hypothetical protein